MKRKFDTLLDAVIYLHRNGFLHYDGLQWHHGSWGAEIVIQKNGFCWIRSF